MKKVPTKNTIALFGCILLSTALLSGCAQPENINQEADGSNMVRVVSDSALLIDEDVASSQGEFYIKNISNHAVSDISVQVSGPVSLDENGCRNTLEPGAVCAVKYTGTLAADIYEARGNAKVLFHAEANSSDSYFQSNGMLSLLRNPDKTSELVVRDQLLMRGHDANFLIHGSGKSNRYEIKNITVNGHVLDADKISLKGNENYSLWIPESVVNSTDVTTSLMKLSINGTVNGRELNNEMGFMVGTPSASTTFQPSSGYLNPTFSVNQGNNSVNTQTITSQYTLSIPSTVANGTTYTATLVPSTSMSTPIAAACANIITNNSAACSATTAGGSGAASSCTESFSINMKNIPTNFNSLTCVYAPQVVDNTNGGNNLTPSNGYLTINVAKAQNLPLVTLINDSQASIIMMGTAGSMQYPPSYNADAVNGASSVSYSGGILPQGSIYRYFWVQNYDTSSMTLTYNMSNFIGNNSTIIESNNATAANAIGMGSQTLCSNGKTILPGGNCLFIMQVNGTGSGFFNEAITAAVTITNASTGVSAVLSSKLLITYTYIGQFIANFYTQMGGPYGIPYAESIPVSRFGSYTLNGAIGGTNVSNCGTAANGNSYQCLMQGSYFNIYLPQQSTGGLPQNFTYKLANESQLVNAGFQVIYTLAASATGNQNIAPLAVVYGNSSGTSSGCTMAAYSNPNNNACYISIVNSWSPNNAVVSGNYQINLVGSFAGINGTLNVINNTISFYAVNPTSKILSMYNSTWDGITGSDSYWNAGESWGYTWNESTPEASQYVNGGGRFFYYAATGVTGDTGCLGDRVTGLLWGISSANRVAANTVSWQTAVSNTIPIKCNGITVANSSGTGTFTGMKTRLPSQREWFSVVDFRNNAPSMVNLGGVVNSTIPTYTAWMLSNEVYNNGGSAYYPVDVLVYVWGGWWNAVGNALTSGFYTHFSYPVASSTQPLSGYLPVVTMPTSVVTPKVTLLKSYGANLVAPPYIYGGDTFSQESNVNSFNGPGVGVGLAWPTGGNGTVSTADNNGGAVPTRFGSGRYINDPTGQCLIDLASGIFYPKNIPLVGEAATYANYIASTTNTDYSNATSNFDKSTGANFGKCGLTNWRLINAREMENSYYYLFNGNYTGGTTNYGMYNYCLYGTGTNMSSIYGQITNASSLNNQMCPITGTYVSWAGNSAASVTVNNARLIATSWISGDSYSWYYQFSLTNNAYTITGPNVVGSGFPIVYVAGGAARSMP